ARRSRTWSAKCSNRCRCWRRDIGHRARSDTVAFQAPFTGLPAQRLGPPFTAGSAVFEYNPPRNFRQPRSRGFAPFGFSHAHRGSPMSRNFYAEINLHITWHTKSSSPLLVPKVEAVTYHYLRGRCINTS